MNTTAMYQYYECLEKGAPDQFLEHEIAKSDYWSAKYLIEFWSNFSSMSPVIQHKIFEPSVLAEVLSNKLGTKVNYPNYYNKEQVERFLKQICQSKIFEEIEDIIDHYDDSVTEEDEYCR